MPEGDTVWRTATRLDAALRGEPITVSDLRWASLATADLTGRTTLEVRARGKHILHRMSGDLTLHSHLRMEGQWRVERTGAVAERVARSMQTRAVVGTQHWTAIGLRLGMLELVRTSEEARVVGHLGPDLLDPEVDVARAVANVCGDGRSIGEALLDQRNVAGIGTMWAAETLFVMRVHPWMPVAQLADGVVEAVVDRAQRFLRASVHHAVQSSTGSRRRGEETYVHSRSGRPCRRCGGTVRVAMIGPAPTDRTMFYCPGCQGGPAPTDDGRPQSPLGSGPAVARDGTSRRRGRYPR